MSRTNAEELKLKLSQQIVELSRREDWSIGQRITERQLATLLGVSRSPIRSALHYLIELGAVERTDSGGYFLAMGRKELEEFSIELPTPSNDGLYLQVIRDHFTNQIPSNVTEADLMRRYNVTRGKIFKLLARLSEEGFVVRKPGHAWQFKDFLRTVRAYRSSYEFRLAIEPAALLSKNYIPDIARLQRLKNSHLQLLEEEDGMASTMFELDAELHETITEFSNNKYMLDSIRHHNLMRRMVEYESYAVHERTRESCLEHIEILDALISDDRKWAAALVTRHLSLASESVEAFMAHVDALQSAAVQNEKSSN